MNREIAIPGGAGVYPLTGDVTSTAGNSTVTVVGIQNIPVQSGVPNIASVLTYNQNVNQWQPIERSSIQVNLLPVSDDYWMSVNATNVKLNGTPIS
jgi:hypothetical protein